MFNISRLEMKIVFIFLFSLLYPSFSLCQVYESLNDQRFVRSVVNMDEMLLLNDYLVNNLKHFAKQLAYKAKIIKW